MFQSLQDSLIQSYRNTLDQYFKTLERKKQTAVNRTPSSRKAPAIKPHEPIRGREAQNTGGIIESEVKDVTQEAAKVIQPLRAMEKQQKAWDDIMASGKWARGISFQNSLFSPVDESKGGMTPLHQFYDSRPFGFFNSRMSDSRFSAGGLMREDSRTFPPSFFGSNDSQL